MSLHAGNDASAYRAAIVYSLISTCKNAGIEPRTWMEDVLTKIPYYLRDGKDLSELLPRHWAKLGNNRTDSDTNRTKSQYALHRRLTVYVFYRVVQAVGIRAGGIVLLGHRVLRRPAGCERVVEAGSEPVQVQGRRGVQLLAAEAILLRRGLHPLPEQRTERIVVVHLLHRAILVNDDPVASKVIWQGKH